MVPLGAPDLPYRGAWRIGIENGIEQTEPDLLVTPQSGVTRKTGDRADAAEADALLCQSLADARCLGLPEAGQIEEMLAQAGMHCDGGA